MLKNKTNFQSLGKSARTYDGLTYRSLQKQNSIHRAKLSQAQRDILTSKSFKNVGWDYVIQLYQELARINLVEKTTLEELFLDADRIGSKYQSPDEILEFNKQMTDVAARISSLVDKKFPPGEVEFSDFRSEKTKAYQKKGGQKTKKYRTIAG